MRNFNFIVFFALISTFGFSQKKGTSDISFNLGFGSSNDVFDMAEDIISGGSYTDSETTPVLNMTYKYAIKDKWFVYADGAFQSMKENVVQDGTTTGNVSRKYFTFGLGSEYHYIVKEWFQMYSGGSIALTTQKSDFSTSSNIGDDKASYLNFQVNAVGFRFGKALAGVVELGVGYKGFATVGVSYQF